MGVVCQIFINRTEDGVFKSGDLVTGTIIYFIEESTKYEGIFINFVGKGNCWWTQSEARKGNTEDYVHQTICFYTGKSGEELSGAFEYPFQFLLPVNIPSSYKDGNCVIDYKVIVTFLRTSKREQFEAEIPVQAYVSSSLREPTIFGLQKNLFSVFANNKIELKGELQNVAVTPGANINLTLKVNNDTNSEIIIKTELIKHFTVMWSCGETNANIIVVPNTVTVSNIGKNMEKNIICIVPTFSNLFSIHNANIIKGEYKVRVTIEVPFPYKDATIDIPVVIGMIGEATAPNAMKNQHYYE